MKTQFSKEPCKKIPDKLPLTLGERIAEILFGVSAAAFAAIIITMLALGKLGSENVVTLVPFTIFCIATAGCSVFPQHTNVFSDPAKYSEKAFHMARRIILAVGWLICTTLFAAIML